MKKTSARSRIAQSHLRQNTGDQLSKQLLELLDKKPRAALAEVSKLIDKDPSNADLWELAGRAHHKLGDFISAEKNFDKALSLHANHRKSLYSKAGLFYAQERFDEAEIFARQAISSLNPTHALPVKLLLANILHKQKKYTESIACFEELIAIEPKKWSYRNHLALIYQELALFDKMHEAYSQAKKLTNHNPLPYFNHIVSSHYDPATTAQIIKERCTEWQRVFKPLLPIERASALNKAKNKKIRIGMISDGFRSHPVGMMISIGLSHVVPSEIEFYAYSTTAISDQITQRIQRITEKWTQVEELSDTELNMMIREDEIDILFDLNGYNSNSRMQTLRLQPAPVMIKWVGGLISSTGLEGMDYLLSDTIETPLDVDNLYTEKLIRLPVDYICYDPPGYLPLVSSLPSEKNGYITFGCFNNASKISDELLSQWAVLLNDVPNSHLFLKSFNFKDASLCERVLSTLEHHGVARERVILEGASPHKELLESYNRVDIALDPWPYSGGLTTCEAMVMGVPVITLPGPTFAGRHSASHLVHAGMPELVADDWTHYRKIAFDLTQDLASLSLIRQHLREILLASPVCDGERFARHFSDAMRAVWQRYCEGKLPQSLSFNEEGSLYFKDEDDAVLLDIPPVGDAVTTSDYSADFAFNLEGKVMMVDYGGHLARNERFKSLIAMNGTFAIIFDPLGIVEDKHLPLKRNSLQHIQMQMLGDGNDRQLYMCLGSEYSSDLPALRLTSHEKDWYPQKVLTTLSAPSIKLDEIHGLNSLEWLVLDNRFNLSDLFAYGSRTLSSCLFVDVYYRFIETHLGQLSFSDISLQLSKFGLEFHSFINIEYANPIEIEGGKSLPSSQMIAAQALFIIGKERRAELSAAQREKLAFILHAGYCLHDAATDVLQRSSTARAKFYASQCVTGHSGAILNANKVKKHPLPQKLIISLTSYHKRFSTLHLTLDCLLNQSIKADRIVLWLADSERSLVPESVLLFKTKGVEIKYFKDIKSYKKIVPMLIEEPNAFIVTADDDLYYRSDWLEKLITAWDGDYKTVVAHRAHKILLGKDSMPIPYKKWNWQYTNASDISGMNFPTSGAGTLYPPHCFHHDVINENIFAELSPNTDDIWLFWMCRLKGVRFKVVGEKMEILEWEGTAENALWRENLLSGGNDNNIRKMISHYGFNFEEGNESVNKVFSIDNLFSFSYTDKLVCMYLPNELDFIQNVIKGNKCFYEPEMLSDIATRSKLGSTIIDIGANIGNHSVYFGLFCGAGKVLSFEPQTEVYDTLCKNISLNNLNEKVTAFKMGLGSYETMASLGVVDHKNIGMTKLEINAGGEIKISTLDSLMENEPKNSISVIKIDVEGMEMEVLRGAIKTLEQHSPVIYVEAASKLEFDEVSHFLAKFRYAATKRFNATATYLFERSA
ncbi:FkbM family methyltransferase [Pantoea sp. LMR881]|uniref:FkbM family methyltransferase n=1 Tax=Pantoea sp. LMR881 TaxID=3014336 RepID=UPI0022AF07FB|nr:FkbM family methyltransferase [Pantoea sp. LMR881]MCZ4058151.1 FkbM family methyltransferase [Pantoea sp. LMR881]